VNPERAKLIQVTLTEALPEQKQAITPPGNAAASKRADS